MKRNRIITLCILVSFILVSGFVFINLSSNNEPLRKLEDILYPASSSIYAQIDNNLVLAQVIDYEISPIGNNSLIRIGSLSNLKNIDGEGFGFRINWTDVPTLIIFSIVLKVPCAYLESEYNFTADITVTIKHNGTFSWHFNVIVSQLIFYKESVTWEFEKMGHGENQTSFDVGSDLLKNASYFFVRDGYIEPKLDLILPLRNGYITDILIDYASIKVWSISR